MRYVGVALLSLLAVLGAQVASASAASHLELSLEGVAVEVGTPIATSSSATIIRTSAGNVTCGEGVMEGTVTANDGSKAELQFTNAEFRRTHHLPAPECESTLALGEPTVTVGGLPWTATLSKKGNGKTHGSRKGKASVTLAFPGATCVLQGATATNAFALPLGEEPIPLELWIPGLKLKLVKGSSIGCPTSGTFEEAGIAVSDQAQTKESPDTLGIRVWNEHHKK